MFGKLVFSGFFVVLLLPGLVIADNYEGIPFVQIPQVPDIGAVKPVTSHHVDLQSVPTVVNAYEQGIEGKAINFISAGDTVFLGENYLDIHAALLNASTIAWWVDENEIFSDNGPDAQYTVSDPYNFFADPNYFNEKTGAWYQWVQDTKGSMVMKIQDPSISLRILDSTTNQDVTGLTIPSGHFGNFIIESNLFSLFNRTGAEPYESHIAINLSGPDNTEYESLIGANYAERSLRQLQVHNDVWYWAGIGEDHSKSAINDGWNTSVINPFICNRIYQPGRYTVQAVCNVNGMKENYLDPKGQEYENKTVSTSQIVMLENDNVSIIVEGAQPFYPGELVSLSGVNGLSDTVYLFICGQDLHPGGGSLDLPQNPALSDDPSTFTTTSVSDNDTWSMQWEIPRNSLKDGTYVLYATSGPKNLTNVNETSYGSGNISIITAEYEDTIDLLSGWNFIETPYVLCNGNDTMELFARVNSSGHSILTFNSTLESWVTMKANDTIIPLTGYWIFSDKRDQIPLVYDKGIPVPSRNLVMGWNTLGITGSERPLTQALSSIQMIWSYIVEYDTILQKYREPIINQNLTDNMTVRPKDGFWIYMTENGTYSG